MIDIDGINQLVEVDDTLLSFTCISWFLQISLTYSGRYINFVLLFIKNLKSEIMQKVNFIVGAQFFTIWIFHPLKITSV